MGFVIITKIDFLSSLTLHHYHARHDHEKVLPLPLLAFRGVKRLLSCEPEVEGPRTVPEPRQTRDELLGAARAQQAEPEMIA